MFMKFDSHLFSSIFPTDIETLDITRIEMTAADAKKVNELLKRPYISDRLRSELNHLRRRKLKAEIESIYQCSMDYLITDYIPTKILLVGEPLQGVIKRMCVIKK